MITKEKSRQIKSHLSGDKNSFKIEASGKAFRTLIDSLYKNKILAIIRELSSNAYDAHCEAGIAERPFELTLPTSLNLEFKIRDFGNSMGHEVIMNLYSTVFYSSKDETNDQVGRFGLGSKSPFSYTDSFSVTSYKNGLMHSYLCFINDENIPTISYIGNLKSCEENGFEVAFSVSDKDISEFLNSARQVFLTYKTQPKLLGNVFEVSEPIYENTELKVKFYELSSKEFLSPSNLYFDQGSVLYPFDFNEDKNNLFKHFKYNTYRHVFANIPVIEVPVGTFDVTPSRDGISYNEETRKSIAQWSTFFIANLKKYIETEYANTANRPQLNKLHSIISNFFEVDLVCKSIDNDFNLELSPENTYLIPDHHLRKILDNNKRTTKPSKIVPIAQYPISSQQLVPGFLYSVAQRNEYRKLYYTKPSINPNLYVGLERSIPRKLSRINNNDKYSTTIYYCFTEDLPRFVRLLNLSKDNVFPLESLPDVPVNRKATIKVNLNSDDCYIVTKSNHIEKSDWFEESSIDNFLRNLQNFSRTYDKFADTNLKQYSGKLKFISTLEFKNSDLPEEMHIGNILLKIVDPYLALKQYTHSLKIGINNTIYNRISYRAKEHFRSFSQNDQPLMLSYFDLMINSYKICTDSNHKNDYDAIAAIDNLRFYRPIKMTFDKEINKINIDNEIDKIFNAILTSDVFHNNNKEVAERLLGEKLKGLLFS